MRHLLALFQGGDPGGPGLAPWGAEGIWAPASGPASQLGQLHPMWTKGQGRGKQLPVGSRLPLELCFWRNSE